MTISEAKKICRQYYDLTNPTQEDTFLLTEDKRKLGYVPEKDNLIFARLMDAGKLVAARIKKIEKKGSFNQISIGIYLVDF